MSTVKNWVTVDTDESGANIDATSSEYIRFIAGSNKTAANAIAHIQVYALPIASVTVGTTDPIISVPMTADGSGYIKFPGEGWKPGGVGLSVAVTLTSTGSGAADAVVTFGIGS